MSFTMYKLFKTTISSIWRKYSAKFDHKKKLKRTLLYTDNTLNTHNITRILLIFLRKKNGEYYLIFKNHALLGVKHTI